MKNTKPKLQTAIPNTPLTNHSSSKNNKEQRKITYMGMQEQWRMDNERRKILVIKTKREISTSNALLVGIVAFVVFIIILGLPGIAVGVIFGGLSFWFTAVDITNKIPNRIVKALTFKLKPIEAYNFGSVQVARTQNLVDGICQREGVDIPQLLVYDDDSINSLVLVFSKKACIILTKGAVELLDRIELEAIIAYQIGKLKTNICSIQLLSISTERMAKYLLYLKPFARKINLDFGMDPELETLRITKYPPGLIDVFKKAKQAQHTALPGNLDSSFGCLWMIQPDNIESSVCNLSIDSKIDLLLDF